MVAALHGPTRESLWSNSNLVAAGLTQYTSNEAHPWDGSGLNQLPEGQLLTSKTGLSGEKDAIDVHAIDIPADTEAVVFYLDGFSQDPDMYVSHGAASVPPSDDNADWQADHISFNSAEQAEFVGLLAPSADEQYFVSVHAFTQYDNANLQVLSVKDTLLCDGCSRLALHKSSQLNASATDEQRTYRFNVPQDAERVVFVIPAGYTGDPDLHISRNKPVSLESFDCRPFSAPQLSEYCEFDLGGTFNVMINPFLDYNNVGLEVYYETKGDTNLLPNALANGSYRGYIDQPLSFSSAGSNDADGTIVSYTWDFGDGNTSTSANPAHSYQSESTYEVSLSVTDDQGATTTDATTAKITLPPLPVIESVCGIQPALEKRQIKVGVTECLPEQHRVSINVSNVKAHNSIAITMNYGQGDADLYFRQGRWPTDTVFHGSSTGQGNNECIYIDDINHEGNFWGYIEVHGAADGASIVVDYDTGGCRTEPLAAQVNGDYSGIVNEDIQFSSDGSFDPQGAISGYKWLFGDGATSKEANPKHNYKVSGEYNVTLTITDDQGNTASASTMAVITLPPAPVLPNSCLTELPSSQGRLTPGKVECLESKTSVGRSVANVDNHQSMAITIDYGQGDATLYYSNGAWPKTTEYQHISNNNGNKECIYIADMGSEAKYWGYILVVGQTEGASIAVDFDTDGCRGSE
ncbi:MAG: PKD repeat protein [Phenylobacterium sp.]|jgi:PKD repeat protein